MNSYFWRTTQQQEIDYIEETDGAMRWNPRKAATQIPSTFLKAYTLADKVVITPENYLEWLI